MTIVDNYLTEVAKALADESYNMPSHLAVATDAAITSISTSDTYLPGEVGTRIAITSTRGGTSVTYEAIRPATDVINTSLGDTLTGFGFMSDLTGSNLMIGDAVSGLIQTINFDVQFLATVTVTRG